MLRPSARTDLGSHEVCLLSQLRQHLALISISTVCVSPSLLVKSENQSGANPFPTKNNPALAAADTALAGSRIVKDQRCRHRYSWEPWHLKQNVTQAPVHDDWSMRHHAIDSTASGTTSVFSFENGSFMKKTLHFSIGSPRWLLYTSVCCVDPQASEALTAAAKHSWTVPFNSKASSETASETACSTTVPACLQKGMSWLPGAPWTNCLDLHPWAVRPRSGRSEKHQIISFSCWNGQRYNVTSQLTGQNRCSSWTTKRRFLCVQTFKL